MKTQKVTLDQLEINQRVFINPDTVNGSESSKGVRFAPNMGFYKGQYAIIVSMNEKGVKLDIDSGRWNWAPEFISLVLSSEGEDVLVTCIKSYPGCPFEVGVETKQKYQEIFSDNEFFDVKPIILPLPIMEIEGYENQINGDNINWGCRSFSKSEFNTIVDAFKILQGKDLDVRVGRGLDGAINYNTLFQIHRKFNS